MQGRLAPGSAKRIDARSAVRFRLAQADLPTHVMGIISPVVQNCALSGKARKLGPFTNEGIWMGCRFNTKLTTPVAKPSFKTRLKGKPFVHGPYRAVLSKS